MVISIRHELEQVLERMVYINIRKRRQREEFLVSLP